MKLTGTIKRGHRIYDNPAAVAIANQDIGEGQRFEETFERFRPIRSLQANARYWGLLVPLAGDLLGKTRDVPLSKEQVHYVLASAFLGCDETALGLAPMPTRTLDSAQFSGYCERVQAWLGENGYAVPESGAVEMDEASA